MRKDKRLSLSEFILKVGKELIEQDTPIKRNLQRQRPILGQLFSSTI